MELSKLKEELRNILSFDRVDDWEELSQDEQGYCSLLSDKFGSVKKVFEEIIDTIKEDFSEKIDRDKPQLKKMREEYTANCKRLIELTTEIINKI